MTDDHHGQSAGRATVLVTATDEILGTHKVERLQSAAQRDELPWENVTIPVGGEPTPFQVYEVTNGWWVAVGRGPDADLTLDSRPVPLAGLALVRVTDLPMPGLRLHFERPETPARQFPADSDPAGAIPGHARVDLTFERSRLLSGSVGGQPVRLELNVPTHKGAAAGSIAGIPVAATWENGDNYRVYPDVPSELQGSFAGQPVQLHATFHLEPGYFFHQGTITGHIGAEDFDATVEAAASGGLGGTRTVAVDGTLGSTEFTIYATIDGPLTFGQIRGTVAGTPIHIDAARTREPDGVQTRLTGGYQGPSNTSSSGTGPCPPVSGVCGVHLDHGQPPACRSDRVTFAGVAFLPDQQTLQLRLPGSTVHHRRQRRAPGIVGPCQPRVPQLHPS